MLPRLSAPGLVHTNTNANATTLYYGRQSLLLGMLFRVLRS